MKKLNKFFRAIKLNTIKYSPEILTGFGIAGMITTTIMAVRATPKALILMEEKKKTMRTEKLPPAEVVKTTWKCYIPAAITGGLSTACLVGASSVNARRNAALATAYSLCESTLKEYQEKVIETIGEKKEQAVRDSIAKDRVEKNPVRDNEVFITEKGNTLCLDTISGRYFRSDVDKIKRVVNDLNYRLLSEMHISLNEFYYELGLKPNKKGDELGWHLDQGLIEVHFSAQIEENGEPCVVLDYSVAPRYGFDYLM